MSSLSAPHLVCGTCRGERWSEMLHAKDDSDPHVADIASMLDLLPLR